MAIITGTGAGETLAGTAGKDTITGAGGDDKALMGGGNDLFVWAPGDGNDTVEGGAGSDTLHFDGDGLGEVFNVSNNGGRVGLSRDVGTVVMDLNDLERIELQALGGTDTVVVTDLTGTDLKQMAINLAGTTPGTGDGALDIVQLNGGKANNTINVAQVGGAISITGFAAQMTVANADSTDELTLQGLDGKDKISAATFGAGLIHLTLDGGANDDIVTGSKGGDDLIGGDGNDTVTGGAGDDLAQLGTGTDLFVWNPGDGNDTVEGGDGVDTLRFVASKAAEHFDLLANGTRVEIDRNVDNVVMDLNQVERIEIRALGGEDSIFVGDLAGTGVTEVIADLAATSGGAAGDKKIDSVIVDATLNDDVIKVASVGSAIVTTGLAAQVSVLHADKTDILILSGGDGNDTIDASKLAAGKLALNLFGGIGNDTLTGSAGNDLVNGGSGNDLAFLGKGDDIFAWNTGGGVDTIEGGAGNDTFQFNGSSGAEFITISTDGDRAQLNSGFIDLNDVERLDIRTVPGPDVVIVDDLAGTDVKLVAVDFGASDNWGDRVDVNGSGGNDKISATLAGGIYSVAGLSAQVTVASLELGNDGIHLNGGAGNDIIDISKLPADSSPLSADGDVGNDTLIGGLADDELHGGDHNDIITGGGGVDQLIGGNGNDLFTWNLGDGNDQIDGWFDLDTFRATGSKANDIFSIFANGALTFSTGGAHLNLLRVERIELRPLQGGDFISIGDLTGTDTKEIAIDLATTAGGKIADTMRTDSISIRSALNDTTTITAIGGEIVATNSQLKVVLQHWDKNDSLIVLGTSGDETVDASALIPGSTVNVSFGGGLGSDHFKGGAGTDFVNGDDGDDVAFLGAGNDTFIWNSGDDNDLIEGGAGFDTLQFKGADTSETIEIDANGGRVAVSDDVGPALLDLNDVERLEIRTLFGFDTVIVNDLSGTAVKQVAIDLATASGLSDGQPDSIFVSGTGGNDVVKIALSGSLLSVTGLPAQVTIAHRDIGDSLHLETQGGNDTINASTLKAGAVQLTLNGGAGNDKITSGAGNDSLTGGDGTDTLSGGAGNDLIVGGKGDDILTGGTGTDTFRYTSVLDGRDVIIGFDGNAAGGQDVLDLDLLFDDLGVAAADRAGRVSIVDKGASVEIAVDTDGDLAFDLAVATLKTADVITVGLDITVGT